MTLKYYGHSCFGIETMGKHLLFDPFITHNPLAKDVDITTISADFVIITHAHVDHMADAEAILNRTGAKLISQYEIVDYFEKKGIKNALPQNVGGAKKYDFGNMRAVTAVHSSSFTDENGNRIYGGVAQGFVIYNEEGCFYFAGDTGLTLDMQLIPMLCPPLDFAILPIGGRFTMDYKDAVVAAEFIQCSTIIGCHFDTWEPVELDHEAAVKAFEAEEKELIIPEINGEIELSA